MNYNTVLYKTVIFRIPNKTDVFHRPVYFPPPTTTFEWNEGLCGEIRSNWGTSKIEHAYSIYSFNIFSIEQHWLTSVSSIFLGFFRSRLNTTIENVILRRFRWRKSWISYMNVNVKARLLPGLLQLLQLTWGANHSSKHKHMTWTNRGKERNLL